MTVNENANFDDCVYTDLGLHPACAHIYRVETLAIQLRFSMSRKSAIYIQILHRECLVQKDSIILYGYILYNTSDAPRPYTHTYIYNSFNRFVLGSGGHIYVYSIV